MFCRWQLAAHWSRKPSYLIPYRLLLCECISIIGFLYLDESSQFTVISVPSHESQSKQDDKIAEVEKTSLSELFGSKPTTVKDIDGQNFFDSISSTENTSSLPLVPQVAQTSFQLVTSVSTQEANGATPSKLNTAEDMDFQSEVPTVPELSSEILQHHVCISCLNFITLS